MQTGKVIKGVRLRTLRGLVCGCLGLALAGCGGSPTNSSAPTSSPVHSSPVAHTTGCSADQTAVTENGAVHCLTISGSSHVHSSSVSSEDVVYQLNAHWPASTNQATQRYVQAVAAYMNWIGGHNFPKHAPVGFPLQWTVGLMNHGGPLGSPIIMWQFSIPDSYIHWTAAQWQSIINILETQNSMGAWANVPRGSLANSQGTGIDEAFQVVAPTGFVVRFIDANTIPVNSLGINRSIPTQALLYSASGTAPGTSLAVLWDEWMPPLPEYPQLGMLGIAHAQAALKDLKTSGQQIWQVLHASSGTSVPISHVPTFSSVFHPSSVPQGGQVPSTVPSSSSPSFSSLPPSSSESSSTPHSTPPSSSSSSPSPSSHNDLSVSVQDAPTGLQVRWIANAGTTPSAGCQVTFQPQGGSAQTVSVANGGVISGLTIGQTYSVQDVSCANGSFGYGQQSIEYGMKATELTSLGPSSMNPTRDWLFVTYDKYLPNQIPDQHFADYKVEDVTAHVSLPVISASLSSGELRLQVALGPSGVTFASSDTIQLTTTASVVQTQHGAPSITDVSGPFN